ncbi:MAG TPA: TVP38/TMEM64 family protein [Thermoanaerobaculia bacterium]|nr:TVP38/TMEM64 family protein [Thermoanaerobaculia bacterium]
MTEAEHDRAGGASPSPTARWVFVGLAIVALIVAARLLPIGRWLASFQEWVKGMGAAGIVLYGVVYIAAVVLFVPGIVLTLGAGFLFGLGRGVVLVSAASTIAAALAFLIARYFARAAVERLAKKDARFEAIDRAIGKEGWKVVALLRLSPLVPFSLSNYLYGLTSVKFWPYVATSWVAMLPATVLYVYLGAAGRTIGQGGHRSPWEWALLAVGLAATAAVTVLLTRVAKRELRGIEGGP